MKNKIHYIITALLTITCIYLAWQLQGVKEYLEIQTEILNKHSELNEMQGDLNEKVYEHIERLYRK